VKIISSPKRKLFLANIITEMLETGNVYSMSHKKTGRNERALKKLLKALAE